MCLPNLGRGRCKRNSSKEGLIQEVQLTKCPNRTGLGSWQGVWQNCPKPITMPLNKHSPPNRPAANSGIWNSTAREQTASCNHMIAWQSWEEGEGCSSRRSDEHMHGVHKQCNVGVNGPEGFSEFATTTAFHLAELKSWYLQDSGSFHAITRWKNDLQIEISAVFGSVVLCIIRAEKLREWPLQWSPASRNIFFKREMRQYVIMSKTWQNLARWSVPFFPNSFSYGVLANIGSGAVPGQLPSSRRDGSRTYWKRSGCGQGEPRDGSLGEPVAVALVPALVLKGAILCVRSFVLAGQFGRFCFRFWKGFGKFSFRTTFVKHVAVTPCNPDVVTANISKHQLTSSRIGKKTCAQIFFACIAPQTLLGITPGLIKIQGTCAFRMSTTSAVCCIALTMFATSSKVNVA